MGLAGDMVLLAFNARGDRLPDRQALAPAVRGALLAELLDDGLLADGDGRVRAVGDDAPADAALRQVWEAVAARPGRTWPHWVRADGRASVHAVLRGMEKDGLLERGTSRVFGIFPLHRAVLTPDGHAAAERVRAAVAAVAEAPAAAGRTALLAGIAHAGGRLGTALPTARRRALKTRLATLSAEAAPVSTAIRQATQSLRAAAS